ncbi:MAG TPA: flagellar basal body rod C-terminal domain-containing protein [Candidatus Acidoferrales bacterium]|nr:flagellar basal body rod C-terminal domain-containing protein [Candidatus Acidoferrales bacterium]
MDSIDLMASAMHAEKTRLDVCAANLANVSTDGFHRSVVNAALTPAGVTTSVAEDASAGPLRHTGRAFDLSAPGNGGFLVRDVQGRLSYERSASFRLDTDGHLADEQRRVLMGSEGPIVASPDATIDERGFVRESGRITARVQLSSGATVTSGFLEAANVDAIHEMVDVLAAQRAFETAQKTLSALDQVRSKATNELARVKS